MQFLPRGPDVPERLLRAHEDGEVVFFCGAGISYPARLPGFQGLVEKLYEALGTTPSEVEKGAVRRKLFDSAIGLLEGRHAGGRRVVREAIARVLTPVSTDGRAIATHAALLELGRTRRNRLRLVTTNFDRLFEAAITKGTSKARSFRAPHLPVPKELWDGIVYLHGLLDEKPDHANLNDLVVSSGDFGLAYLTEGWAARFVAELFRRHTVCFIGYSIADPVLRYMMDALAADRMLGETPREVFAFGSFSKRRRREVEHDWKAKNVTPILYAEHARHAYLHRTIQEWSKTYRDGAAGKEQIVARHAKNMPVASTREDDYVGRVLWAISDQTGLPARRFRDMNPTLDWLEPLTDRRMRATDLLRFAVQPYVRPDDEVRKLDEGLTFSILVRPTQYHLAPRMAPISTGWSGWDPVMWALAEWLAGHLADPRLLLWIAKNGGHLHPQFERLIIRQLATAPPPPRIATLWSLALAGRLKTSARDRDIFVWTEQVKRNGFGPIQRLWLRDLLRPCLRLGGFAMEEADLASLGLLGAERPIATELELVAEHVHSALATVNNAFAEQDSLAEFLPHAEELLGDALDLLREVEKADSDHDLTYILQPSISESDQNRKFNDWTVLIDLTRDGWLALARSSPQLARDRADEWSRGPYPVFRRLALFAATQSTVVPPGQALQWLLADDGWWLWAIDTQREALRFIAMVGKLISEADQSQLELAILEGPPLKMFRADLEADDLQATRERVIWLRLEKCQTAGLRLGALASARLTELRALHPNWRLAAGERDEFPAWSGEVESGFSKSPRDFLSLVAWLREHPQSDYRNDDDWSLRCKQEFRLAARVLRTLASSDEWFVGRWAEALQVWTDDRLICLAWRILGPTLLGAPLNVVHQISHPLARLIEGVSTRVDLDDPMFLPLLMRILDAQPVAPGNADGDPVSRALNHPVGNITSALIRAWSRSGVVDGQGLGATGAFFSKMSGAKNPSLLPGRVMMASNLVLLYRVDPAWTTSHFLPLFQWGKAQEAPALWDGFLVSPRLFPPLMECLREDFLLTAENYERLGEQRERFAAVLTFAALDQAPQFSRQELRKAFESLPREGLDEAAVTLVNALAGAGAQRAEYWTNRILPFIRLIWPKSGDKRSKRMSQHFARLCIVAGALFEAAVNETRPWLGHIEFPDYLIGELHGAGVIGGAPLASLEFLDLIVPDNAMVDNDLRECLDEIVKIDPRIAADPRFLRLREVQKRQGH